MKARHLPTADLLGLPGLIRQSLREHAAGSSPTRDWRLLATWKAGSAASEAGPLLVSLTQYTPHRLSDLFDIWRTADILGDELTGMDHAYGVVTYLQPGRRRVGSLSVWTDESGLRAFVGLPYHCEVMRKYRPRGLPLRSAKWWSDDFRLGIAMAEGQDLLDASQDRRVERDRS